MHLPLFRTQHDHHRVHTLHFDSSFSFSFSKHTFPDPPTRGVKPQIQLRRR
jgi:hypothetical protein